MIDGRRIPLSHHHADSPLVEKPSLLVENQSEFKGFKQYLIAEGRRNTKQIVLYAIKYGYILQSGDAHEILGFSNTKKRHIMESLVCLSKYLGCYNTWKEIKERYQLKWSNGDSLDAFHSMFDNEENYSTMLSWLKDTCSRIPKSYSNILIYNTLTGLRPNEACQSLELLKSDSSNYLNKNKMVLEHYKYKIFLRRSKKALISIVDDRILEIGNQTGDCGYNALRSYLKKRSMQMNMAYCRKIFATYLRTNGIEQELIDLLQGRIPRTVFARHYFRPDFNPDRIRKVLDSLHREII